MRDERRQSEASERRRRSRRRTRGQKREREFGGDSSGEGRKASSGGRSGAIEAGERAGDDDRDGRENGKFVGERAIWVQAIHCLDVQGPKPDVRVLILLYISKDIPFFCFISSAKRNELGTGVEEFGRVPLLS